MTLRFAVHNADNTLAKAGLAPPIPPEDERRVAESWLRPLLNPGQRLVVGWDECETCGTSLTDSPESPSPRAFCSAACERA